MWDGVCAQVQVCLSKCLISSSSLSLSKLHQRLMLTIISAELQRYTHVHANISSCTQNKHTSSLQWHIKSILWPLQKKSMKAVTQMEKSWQVKKSRGQDRSWSRHSEGVGGVGGVEECGAKRAWAFQLILAISLYGIYCCFCEHRILNHLIGYLQQAVCGISMRAIVYSLSMGIWLDAVAHCKLPLSF